MSLLLLNEDELQALISEFELIIAKYPNSKNILRTKECQDFKAKLENIRFNNHQSVDGMLLSLLTGKLHNPKCHNPDCDNLANPILKRRSWTKFCSHKCSANFKETQTKRLDTFFHRYGVTSNFSREATQNTILEKFGVRNAAQSPQVLEKIVATKRSTYGIDPLLTDAAKNRAAQKRKENYAASRFRQRLIEINKISQCQLTGDDIQWAGINHYYEWVHSCGHVFRQRLIKGQIPICPACAPKSKPEEILIRILNDLGVTYTVNDRKIISPYELDFVIADANIAIEVNGIYWHREEQSKLSLLEKTMRARDAGFQLLHFWDFEINEKPEIVKRIIKSKLKIDTRIFARKTSVVDLDVSQAKAFANEFHISGFIAGNQYLGLMFNEEIVALAIFGKSRFEKGKTELLRYCSNGTVVGGLSKLIKHAITTANHEKIVTFADKRFSTAASYSKIGFSIISDTAPNYFWAKGNQRVSRYQAMKHKLKHLLKDEFDENESETKNMHRCGWYRVFDCGNVKCEL